MRTRSVLFHFALALWITHFTGCGGGNNGTDLSVGGGCQKDTDCKGDRVCLQGQCVSLAGGSDLMVPPDLLATTPQDIAMPDLASRTCTIKGVVHMAGEVDPNNHCQHCDPLSSTTSWTPLDNGASCGMNLVCVANACVSACYIAGVEWMGGQLNPMNSCQSCNPMMANTAWTNLGDGTACGAGKVCNQVVCTAGCYIANTFYPEGMAQANNPCASCQGMVSTTQWSPLLAEGTSCGTGTVCEKNACVAGCFINNVYYTPLTILNGRVDGCWGCAPTVSTSQAQNFPDGTGCAYSRNPPLTDGVCLAGKCQGQCWINNQTWLPSVTNPQNVCQICNPPNGATQWSDNNGATCGKNQGCVHQACAVDWTLNYSAPGYYAGIWGSSATDIYVVGATLAFTPLILHSTGNGNWQTQVAPNNMVGSLYSVWGSGPNDVYAVGDSGIVLRTTDGGKTWVQVAVPRVQPLTHVWGSGPNDVYVSTYSQIWHSFNQGAWWNQQLPEGGAPDGGGGPFYAIGGIWGSAANDVYVVDGSLIHSTGNGTWSMPIAPPKGTSANLIWGSAANDVWIADGRGNVQRTTNGGGSFNSLLADPNLTNFQALWGSSATDVYVANDRGYVVHTQNGGMTWLSERLPDATVQKMNFPTQIWGSGPNDVYAIVLTTGQVGDAAMTYKGVIEHRP